MVPDRANDPPFRVILSANEFEKIASKARETTVLDSICITRLSFLFEVTFWYLDGTYEEMVIPIVDEGVKP